MIQIKGNSAVQRNFWQADEFADYENADSLANYSNRKMEKKNFVRHGVVKGLAHDKNLGANPCQLGLIGGTDNHNGMMSDVDEDNFVDGHGPENGPVKARRTVDVGSWILGKDLSIGSLSGVWATAGRPESKPVDCAQSIQTRHESYRHALSHRPGVCRDAVRRVVLQGIPGQDQ